MEHSSCQHLSLLVVTLPSVTVGPVICKGVLLLNSFKWGIHSFLFGYFTCQSTCRISVFRVPFVAVQFVRKGLLESSVAIAICQIARLCFGAKLPNFCFANVLILSPQVRASTFFYFFLWIIACCSCYYNFHNSFLKVNFHNLFFYCFSLLSEAIQESSVGFLQVAVYWSFLRQYFFFSVVVLGIFLPQIFIRFFDLSCLE